MLLFFSMITKADVPYMGPPLPSMSVTSVISNVTDFDTVVFLTCEVGNYPYRMEQMHCKPFSNLERFNNHASGRYSFRGVLAIPKALYREGNTSEVLRDYTFKNDYPPTDPIRKKVWKMPVTLAYTDEHGEDLNYTETNETRIYRITSVTDDNVTIKLDKRVIQFDDGTVKTISY